MASGRTGAFGLLRDSQYAALWSSGTAGHMARTAEVLVGGYVVAEATGSPLMVALVGFCRVLPFAFGPWVGAAGNRYGRRRVLLSTLGFGVLACLVASVSGFLGAIPIPLLALAGLCLGIGWPVDWTVRRTLSADIVGPEKLLGAMVLDAGSLNVARIFGAPMGGLLLALGGAGPAYLGLALINLISFLCVWTVQEPEVTRGAPPSIRESFRTALSSGPVAGVLLVTIFMNLLIFPYQQLVSFFGQSVLQISPAATGLLASADGFGQLGATLLLAGRNQVRRRGRTFLLGAATCGVGALCFSLSPWPVASFASLFLVGIGIAFFVTLQGTIPMASVAPEERLGVMGVVSMAIGTFPLGTLLVGASANVIGAPAAGAIAAAAGLIAIIISGVLAKGLREAQE